MTAREKTKYRTSKKWKSFRSKLIDKHRHRCQVCGTIKRGKQTRYLQVHHINEEAYGNETEEDVVLLCSSCHQEVERFLRRKEFDIDIYCDLLADVYRRSKSNGA